MIQYNKYQSNNLILNFYYFTNHEHWKRKGRNDENNKRGGWERYWEVWPSLEICIVFLTASFGNRW